MENESSTARVNRLAKESNLSLSKIANFHAICILDWISMNTASKWDFKYLEELLSLKNLKTITKINFYDSNRNKVVSLTSPNILNALQETLKPFQESDFEGHPNSSKKRKGRPKDELTEKALIKHIHALKDQKVPNSFIAHLIGISSKRLSNILSALKSN